MEIEASSSIENDKEKEIADLQHQLHAFEQQCAHLEKDYEILKGENIKLKKHNEYLTNDATERMHLSRNLEHERDELSKKVHQLDNENIMLRTKIEVFEGQIVNITTAKESFQEKIQELTSDINSLKENNENLRMKLEKNADEARRNKIERESWNDQRMIYESSKNWYLKEIKDRDENIGNKSIMISRLELQLQEVKASVNEKEDNLQHEIMELKTQLMEKDENIKILMQESKENYEERVRLATSHDSIVSNKEKIIETLKEALEEEQKKNDFIVNQNQTMEEELEDIKNSSMHINADLDKSKAEYTNELRIKDEIINDLKNEIVRLNSSGINSDSTFFNNSFSDINEDPTGILRQSKTLSSFILAHSQISAERDSLKEKVQYMENRMNDFAENMAENVKILEDQLVDYKETLLDNKSLRVQVGSIQEMLEDALETKDKLIRELNYTKTQLIRYQADSQELNKQVKRLLFMIESEKRGYEGSEIGDNENLFSDIDSLQKVNSELRSRLLLLEANKEDDLRKAREVEAEKLNAKLMKAEKDLSIIEEQMKIQTEMLKKTQEQRDHFAETIENYNKMGLSADAQHLRMSVDELKNEKTRLEAKVSHLESLTASFNEQKTESDKIYKNRIDEQVKLITDLRETVGKLESDVQYLRQLNRTTAQKCESMERISDRINNKMNVLTRENEKKTTEIMNLNTKLIDSQEEISRFKVEKRNLEEQNRLLASSEARLQAENETLRQYSQRANKVESAVDEIQDFIKKMNEDQAHNSQSQVEALIKQRDSINETFKTTMEQNNRNINDLKLTISKLENEKKNIEDKAKLIEASLRDKETEIINLKDKISITELHLGQFNDATLTSEDYKGEVRKIGTAKAYLERRCAELEELVNDYKLKLKVKDEQLNKVSEFSEDVESALKQANDLECSERSRLQQLLVLNEKELAMVKKNLEDSQLMIESLQNESNQKSIDYETFAIKMKSTISENECTIQQLNNSLEGAARDATSLREEIDNLTQLKDSLSETITSLENHVLKLEKSVEEKEAALKKSEYTLKENQIALISLNEEYDAYKCVMDTERERLQLKIDEMVKAEKQKVETNDHMLSDLRNLIATFTAMKEKDTLSCTMNTSFAENDDEDSTEKYIETIGRLNRMIECLQNDCQSTLQRCAQAECELTNVRSSLAVEKTNTSLLETKVKELRNTIEIQLQELKDKNVLVQKMKIFEITKAELDRVKEELEEVNNKCNELQSLLSEKENVIIKLESQNIYLENERDNLKNDITSVTKERDSWKKQHAQSVETLAKYGPSKCEMLVNEIETTKANLIKVKEENEKNKKLIEELSSKPANAEEEEDYKNKFIRVRKLARDYRQQVQILKEKSEKLEKMVEDGNKESKDGDSSLLQTQLSEKESEIVLLNQEIVNLKDKIDDLNLELERNSMMETLVQQYSSDLKNREHEISRYKEEVQVLKTRIESLLKQDKNDDIEEEVITEESTNDDVDDLGNTTPENNRKRGLSQELDIHDDLGDDVYDNHKKTKFDESIDILQNTEDILEDV
uniref:TPR_MLP1_2 domain-containing protein n=1 Tax=Parastrongyloides trichosuri TaxID=131310 RepID=A0A0N4ZMP9_PARTI